MSPEPISSEPLPAETPRLSRSKLRLTALAAVHERLARRKQHHLEAEFKAAE